MLLADDQALVEAERDLPGLRVLLDPERFADRLGSCLPGMRVELAELAYLRYKPRMSCLGAYRLRVDGVPLDACVKALRDGEIAKLHKADDKLHIGPLGLGRLVLAELGLSIYFFPNDRKLRSLRRLCNDERRASILRKTLPSRPTWWEGDLRRLAYKPERRYVGSFRVSHRPVAVLKMHSRRTFLPPAGVDRPLENGRSLRVPRLLGHSPRHGLVVWEWLAGDLLRDLMSRQHPNTDVIFRTGVALAEFHRSRRSEIRRLPDVTRRVAQVRAAADSVAGLHRGLTELARSLAAQLVPVLAAADEDLVNIHGDFYSKQVVVQKNGLGIIDLDAVRTGESSEDLANFIAHLERDAVSSRLPEDHLMVLREALLEGYRKGGGSIDRSRLAALTAAGLVRIAPHPFRNRESQWVDRTRRILQRAESLLASSRVRRGTPRGRSTVEPLQVRRMLAAYSESRAVDDLGVEGVRRIDLVDGRLLVTIDAAGGPAWHLLKEGGSCALEPAADPELPLSKRLNGSRVLAYRPFRRLCLRRGDDGAGMVEKGYRKGRSSEKDRAYRLAGVAAGADSFRVLPVREHRVRSASLVFDLVAGHRVPVRAGFARDFHRIGAHLRRFQGSEAWTELDCFDHQRELGVLDVWADRVVRISGSLPPGWAPARERLDGAVERLGGVRYGLAHRDLHDGQLLRTDQGMVLLDFDLLCGADIALDPANFLSHLELRALQGLAGADRAGAEWCARAFREGLGYRWDGDFEGRLSFYRGTSLLRLALVYSLRPRWKGLTGILAERAGEVLGSTRT